MKKHIILFAALVISVTSFAFNFYERRTAEVEQVQGVFIFHKGQKPTDETQYLGTVELNMVKNYKPENVIPQILKKAKEKYPNVQAILLTEENNWKCDVVTFK